MEKTFNTEGYCDPELHYMVDLSGRLAEIKTMVDAGKYFAINRGEQQLLDYLEHFHLNKGYMLSFCFNKKKKIGLQDIAIGDKVLVEAVV